jgi:O-antigen ligase
LRPERTLSWRFVGAWMLVLAVPVVLASAVPLAASLSTSSLSKVAAFGRDDSNKTDEEANLRLELWSNAIHRGFETDMLGLGPGPHLPIPAILLDARWGSSDEPVNVQHPTPGGVPNFESHNSLLELFLQGGLLAVVSFLAIFLTSFVHALRTKHHVLATALCGILLFGSFHVITRHPAVWFMIVMGLVADPGFASIVDTFYLM